LHVQLLQQQQETQMQQHELGCMRQQLQQVKDLHKRKMHQLKQQLRQQYEVQLQATTAAYAQELAQIQSHLAYSRTSGGLWASSAAAAAAAAAGLLASGAIGNDMSSPGSSPRPKLMQQLEQPASVGSGPGRALTHQQLQQQQQPQQHVQAPTAYAHPQRYQQQQQQQHDQQQHYQQHYQQQHSSCQGLDVPAEVLEYAERYQQGTPSTISTCLQAYLQAYKTAHVLLCSHVIAP
jgi:hypothetical protein